MGKDFNVLGKDFVDFGVLGQDFGVLGQDFDILVFLGQDFADFAVLGQDFNDFGDVQDLGTPTHAQGDSILRETVLPAHATLPVPAPKARSEGSGLGWRRISRPQSQWPTYILSRNTCLSKLNFF